MVDVYRSHRPDISLLPDARACLDELRGRVDLAIVTDGPFQSQRAKAAALGLGEWVDSIVFTEELGPGLAKPHPASFQMIEKETGCSGPECVYVADNPAKDFSGPRSLGWSTVRVRRQRGLHSDVDSGSDVDIELGDLWLYGEALGTPAGLVGDGAASSPIGDVRSG